MGFTLWRSWRRLFGSVEVGFEGLVARFSNRERDVTLRKGTVERYWVLDKWAGPNLRFVHYHCHTCIAVLALGAVKPQRIGAVDGDGESFVPYSFFDWHEVTPDACLICNAGLVESALSNIVILRVELEFEHITLVCCYGIGDELEATFADRDDGSLSESDSNQWEDGAENGELHLSCS